MKQSVSPATDYRENMLHEFGIREPMLLWQHEFPVTEFDDGMDQLISGLTSDLLNKTRRRHYQDFIGCDPMMPLFSRLFERWARPRYADPQEKLNMLVKMVGATPVVRWTGFRISAWVDDSSRTIFRIELFAKHGASETEVTSRR